MCGITGYVDFKKSLSGRPDVVRKMADTLHHRGPDDSGEWHSNEDGLALGFRRLSILDLSANGRQPMVSASGRYVIVFNGEIYNFREIKAEILASGGFLFKGHSDTEVMLAAFEKWGIEESLNRFNGMFAFALWDGHAKILHLARDRFGEKPLYYGRAGDVFFFGSELKALRAHPAFCDELDLEALGLYFRYTYVPAPYSIYKGISKLLPGHRLELAAKSAEMKTIPYWSAERVIERARLDPFRGNEDEAAAELDRILRKAVGLRMNADVPLGAFLSGGIDSSIIVAHMQAQSERPVQTFTIGFENRDYDEAPEAAAVAKHLGTDHTALIVTASEAQGVIPTLSSVYDEPFADSSQIPTCLMAKMARRKVSVALSGDAGDELFGGYTRYFWGRRVWGSMAGVPLSFRSWGAKLLEFFSPQAWDRLGHLLIPDHRRPRNLGNKLQKLSGALAFNDQEELYRGLVTYWKDRNPTLFSGGSLSPHAPAWPTWDGDISERMMYLDTVTYLPDDILVKMDRACMSEGLEPRVPFLDPHLFEFAWGLPLSMKIFEGGGKILLRKALNQHLPASLFERPKAGFAVPLGEWLTGPLRDWTESLIGENALQGDDILNAPAIRKKWAEHLAGRRDWQEDLWQALMFQAWRKNARLP